MQERLSVRQYTLSYTSVKILLYLGSLDVDDLLCVATFFFFTHLRECVDTSTLRKQSTYTRQNLTPVIVIYRVCKDGAGNLLTNPYIQTGATADPLLHNSYSTSLASSYL